MSAPVRIHTDTIGQAWIDVAVEIIGGGAPGFWDGAPLVEIMQCTVAVDSPAPQDQVIARLADPERLAWMHANFTDHARVAALGDADSYATRLFDYAHSGRDQIAWVVEKLRRDPFVRDATITTFQPLTDTSYVPCVSLLDFWQADNALHLGVYAHGIDFGTKGYANLVELADLQHRVAAEIDAPVGTLTMTIKSAHIYDTDMQAMSRIVAATA